MANISVSLFIESEDATVDDLSFRIGLEPNAGWSKGEPRGATGKLYTTSSWKLTEKVSSPDDADEISSAIEGALASTLAKVANCEEKVSAVAAMNTAGLLIAISSKFAPPLVVKSELLRAISLLGVDLEIDIVVY